MLYSLTPDPLAKTENPVSFIQEFTVLWENLYSSAIQYFARYCSYHVKDQSEADENVILLNLVLTRSNHDRASHSIITSHTHTELFVTIAK